MAASETPKLGYAPEKDLADAFEKDLFWESLISRSYFHFHFDLTGDCLIYEDDTSFGYHPIREACGKELPVHYDEWAQRWYELYEPEFDVAPSSDPFSVAAMRRAYERGERLQEFSVRQRVPWGGLEYTQFLVLLAEHKGDHHVYATVIWRIIGEQSARRETFDRNLRLKISNEALQRTLSQEEQFRVAALSGAIMAYNINLTRNSIEDEFYEMVDGKRYAMIQMVGLTAPCNFDEFRERWSALKVPEDSRETFLNLFNGRYLLDAYNRGERLLEIEFDTTVGRNIPITLRNTVLLLKDEKSGDILATVSGKDVSAQRTAERSQREAFEAANAANAAKSDFLARMSHDIRTPMNAIMGMTTIARAHLDDRERVEDCLDKISLSSEHLLGLINDILDMSKIESGKMELQEEDFNLPELVDSLLTMCRPQIQAKEHTLSSLIRNIRHENVRGDSKRLRQVFMNLMSNAVKYTPDGGQLRLIITEWPSDRPGLGKYEFVFQDNGIGMTEEYQEHIFDPFSRAEDKRVSKVQGTGLGMAITKSIVEMMGGTIRIRSAPGKGSKFTVTLFLKLQSAAENKAGASFPGVTALAVDADRAICRAACQRLIGMGVEADWALSREEALQRLEERRKTGKPDYDVVVLDRALPGNDWVELVKALKAANYRGKIALAAYEWADIEQAALELGVELFAEKPVFTSRFIHLLNQVVGREAGHRGSAAHTDIDALAHEDFTGRRVLVAEDNELNAEIAKEILEMAHLRVEFAENGQIAVEKLSAAEDGYYDLIFMDIQMPVMNGYEAARAIRALDRDYARRVPIVAMSANTFAEDIQKALDSGMNGHIPKPLDIAQLDKVLRTWMGRGQKDGAP